MANIASLSARISKRAWTRYAVALLVTLAALLVRLALNPFLGESAPYVMLLPAVAFSAWYCGVGPSLLSVVLALIGARYWFIPPVHTLGIVGTAQAVGILAFLLASGVLLAMGEARRRREERLWAAQRELEAAVQERTAELDTTNHAVVNSRLACSNCRMMKDGASLASCTTAWGRCSRHWE